MKILFLIPLAFMLLGCDPEVRYVKPKRPLIPQVTYVPSDINITYEIVEE